MAFIRIKNIKNKQGKKYPYVYLVENRWKQKKVKQKVSKYLGRAIKLDKTNTTDFFDFFNTHPENYFRKKKNQEIIRDLLTWTLNSYGFDTKQGVVETNSLTVNPSTGEITSKKGKNNIILQINDGFLCEYTIRRLKIFKRKDNEEKDKYRLAVYFVESGIKVPKEIFVEFYSNAPKV